MRRDLPGPLGRGAITSLCPAYATRGVERLDALQRLEVVGQRIGPRSRIQADRRRDAGEDRVARDQHPVTEEDDVPVRMAAQHQHAPPVHLVAVVEELRIAHPMHSVDQARRLAQHRVDLPLGIPCETQ